MDTKPNSKVLGLNIWDYVWKRGRGCQDNCETTPKAKCGEKDFYEREREFDRIAVEWDIEQRQKKRDLKEAAKLENKLNRLRKRQGSVKKSGTMLAAIEQTERDLFQLVWSMRFRQTRLKARVLSLLKRWENDLDFVEKIVKMQKQQKSAKTKQKHP